MIAYKYVFTTRYTLFLNFSVIFSLPLVRLFQDPYNSHQVSI